MKYLLLYLLTVNASGFLLMLADKHRAQKKMWRIPESTLMAVAVAGGAPGCLMGMYAFRHKTRHSKFTLGIPAILLCQLLLGWLMYHLF